MLSTDFPHAHPQFHANGGDSYVQLRFKKSDRHFKGNNAYILSHMFLLQEKNRGNSKIT